MLFQQLNTRSKLILPFFFLLASISSCKKNNNDVANNFEDYPQNLQVTQGGSPIKIAVASTIKFKSLDPVIHYTSFFIDKLSNTAENLKVYVPANSDNYITIRGKRYDLLQFHFHRDSEHGIQTGSDTSEFIKGVMEVHFVHQASDGSLAVIGVILQNGSFNSSLQPLFEACPKSAGDLNNAHIACSVNSFLPSSKQYYTYSGSLTTSPYTAGLTWIVYKEPKFLSEEQLIKYARIYPEANARSFQLMASRLVYENINL